MEGAEILVGPVESEFDDVEFDDVVGDCVGTELVGVIPEATEGAVLPLSPTGAVNCLNTIATSFFSPFRKTFTTTVSLKLRLPIMLGICAREVSLTPAINKIWSPIRNKPYAPEPGIISETVTTFGPDSLSFTPRLGFSLPKPSGTAGSPFFLAASSSFCRASLSWSAWSFCLSCSS